jgi:CubicO group peptidase (beta-lactamase class C family)
VLDTVAVSQGRTALQELLDGFLADAAVPGAALGIARAGQPVEVVCAGNARLGPRQSVTPETRFRLASLTKQVVAVAVLRMIERGELALDTPVASRVRSVRLRQSRGAQPITVAHLLLHVSGLGDLATWRQLLDDDVQLPLDIPPRLRARRAPGLRWDYCNLGYALLARLVEEHTERSFDEYVADTILDSLGLTGMSFASAAPLPAELANAYEPHDEGWRCFPSPAPELPAAAGLLATPSEAVRLGAAMLEPGRLLERPLGEHLGSATFTVDDRLPRQCPFLIRVELDGHEVFWHDGFDGGFSSALYLVPEAGLALAVLTNGPTCKIEEEFGPRVLRALLGSDGPHAAPAMRRAPQRCLCGRYRYPAVSPLEPRPPDVVVIAAGDDLWLSSEFDDRRIRLVPEGEDPLLFRMPEGACARRVLFVTDRPGVVSGLCMDGFVVLARRRFSTAVPWRVQQALRDAAARTVGLVRKGRG